MTTMSGDDDVTLYDRLHSKTISNVDGTGGTFSSLFDALDAADEAGYDVGHLRELAESASGDLDEAMAAADTEDPDHEEVHDRVTSATNAMASFLEDIGGGLAEYELPGDVDSGLYDTFEGYAEYVYEDLLHARNTAARWAEAA